MKCPACGKLRGSKVFDTRPKAGGTENWRRRECPCGERFTTYEIGENELNQMKHRLAAFNTFLKANAKLIIELGYSATAAFEEEQPCPTQPTPSLLDSSLASA